MTEKLRLHKAIAQAGIASRRKAEALIAEGKVRVNGKLISAQGTLVDLSKDSVEVNGKLLALTEQKKYYFLLNKPAGYLTSTFDPHNKKTVMQLIPKIKGLFPVGRLDKDTTGLLLITNDGELAYRLMHPKFGIYKTYLAEISGAVSEKAADQLRKGVHFDDKISSPCKVEILKKTKDITVIQIEIHEGRKRQIRLMLAELGYKVLDLKRVKYAGIKNDIDAGAFRELERGEISGLYKQVGLTR